MDFTQPNEFMPGKMGMVKGASACIVRVTMRKKYSVGGGTRTRRSIWVIADDGKICIQHKCMLNPESVFDSQADVFQYLKAA